MTERRLRLLVVNQRMDRTGGPTQLATLLRGLCDAVPAEVVLLGGSGGPLRNIVQAHVDRMTSEPWWCRAIGRVERASPPRLARRLAQVWCWLMRRHVGRVDVVYVNSLISRRLARPFHSLPMVVHVHELRGVADSFGIEARALVRAADVVLVPSRAALHWVHDVGVPHERTLVLPGAVPEEASQTPSEGSVAELRRRLGLRSSQQLVATIGWLGELKGTDRFLDVARRLAEAARNDVVLVWVGGGTERQRAAFDAATRAPELAGRIRRLDDLDDLRPLYAVADLVLVTSREESLSLVALEAAAQARPIVCFPGAGGPDELAEEGIVRCAASTDPSVVAALIEYLLQSADRRAELAASAAAALEHHHSVARSRGLLVEALRRAHGRD